MTRYIIRRLLTAIPTLIAISMVIFTILALAPGDPMVLAARAMAEARLLLFTGESPSAAAAAAERAIAAAPAHGEPYLALALCRFLVGDVVGALAALRQALARNPNLAEAHGMVGMVLSELDAADEAERRLQAAVSLDAQLNTAVDTLVRTAMLRGDWPRVDALLAAHGRDEPLTSRMRGFIWRRDREAAAAFAAELAGETQEQLHLGHVFAEAVARGRATPEFEALVREAIANGSPRGRLFVRQLAAEVLAAVGEEERALATIAAAVDEGLLDVAWLDRCPLFDGLRADPRFAPLRATVRRRADEVLAAWRAPL